MPNPSFQVEPQTGSERLRQAYNLLGGRPVLGRPPKDPLAAHELIVHGIPGRAIVHFVDRLRVIDALEMLGKGIGISVRTYQRHKDRPDKALKPDVGGRAWKSAEILAKAITVFGSQEKAEQWMNGPATGLNRQRPLDLLSSPAGVELVEDFLERLEYGVYV